MNEVIQNILSRRSIRSYSEKQISDEDLDLILQCAKHAPSGGNSQSWHFTVIQNKEKLKQLNSLIRKAFKNLEIDESTYRSKKSGKKAAENENYSFYYNAPTLIIVSNEREYPNAMADSSASMQNIFLSAHSLGLGSCFINQLTWFGEEADIKNMLLEFGVPKNHKVCGSAAIGYLKGNYPKASVRKDGNITVIK